MLFFSLYNLFQKICRVQHYAANYDVPFYFPCLGVAVCAIGFNGNIYNHTQPAARHCFLPASLVGAS